jgi:hypothetical protein
MKQSFVRKNNPYSHSQRTILNLCDLFWSTLHLAKANRLPCLQKAFVVRNGVPKLQRPVATSTCRKKASTAISMHSPLTLGIGAFGTFEKGLDCIFDCQSVCR